MEKITKAFRRDFSLLEAWRKDNVDKFPILSLLHVYEAVGLADEVRAIRKEIPDFQLCPIEHLFCNFDTLEKIRKLIRDNWEHFNLQMDSEGNISWIPNQPHDPRKFGRKMKARVRDSVLFDQNNFCPNLDPAVDDDTLVFFFNPNDKKETLVVDAEVNVK